MLIPLILMLVAATIGSFDLLYYHFWKFKLYAQPTARMETATHLVRGILFSTGALVLASYEPRGAWYWVIGSLFVLDFVNSVADVLLETKSRAPLGGVPPLEYMIHIVGSTLAGAIAAAYFLLAYQNAAGSTALAPLPAGRLPEWFLWQARLLAISGFGVTFLEAALTMRFCLQARRTEA